MSKTATPIRLMTYTLKPMTIKIYTYGFPTVLKQKLAELAVAVNPKYDYESYQLPLCAAMRRICENWLFGLVEIKSMSKKSDDTKWLVSLEKIDPEILCQYLRAATDSFYNGDKIKSDVAKQKLIEFKQAIKSELFLPLIGTEDIAIIDGNNQILSNYAYAGFGLKLMDLLVGKSINIHGHQIILRRSGRRELMSDPLQNDEGEFYSFVFNFDLQTTPPLNEQMLLLSVGIRKFRTRSEGAKSYLKNTMSVYIKTPNGNFQRVGLKPAKIGDAWTQVWETSDKLCCNFNGFGSIPEAHEVFMCIEKYCQDEKQQILCTISTENDYASESSVGTGVSFVEKKAIYEQIYELIYEIVECSPEINKAIKPMRHFIEVEENFNLEVRKRLAINVNTKLLDIEIYFFDKDKEWAEDIKSAIDELIGTDDSLNDIIKINVHFKQLSDYAQPVPKQDYEKIKQKRINEIVEVIGYADERIPTGSIIILDKYNDDIKDVKGLLRCAYAKTNRITQFIIPRVEDDKRFKDKEAERKHKIKTAVNDLFRQFGFTVPVLTGRYIKSCPVIGLFSESKVKSIYGKEVKCLPFALTFNIDTGKIVVESPLINQGTTLPYYRACIELCKLSMEADCVKIADLAKRRFIEQKIKGLENYYRDKDGVVIVVGEGIMRNEFWPGISNKKIECYDYSAGQYHPSRVDIGEKGMIVPISLGNSKLRIIRIRTSNEVPDYFSSTENEVQHSTYGIYAYNQVYYSVLPHPNNKEYITSYKKTHFDNLKFGFKERTLIEYFPIMLQDGDCATDYINFIDELRWLSPQYKNATNFPMPIHYLTLLKEYFEVD